MFVFKNVMKSSFSKSTSRLHPVDLLWWRLHFKKFQIDNKSQQNEI